MTDGGSEFKGEMKEECEKRGIQDAEHCPKLTGAEQHRGKQLPRVLQGSKSATSEVRPTGVLSCSTL